MKTIFIKKKSKRNSSTSPWLYSRLYSLRSLWTSPQSWYIVRISNKHLRYNALYFFGVSWTSANFGADFCFFFVNDDNNNNDSEFAIKKNLLVLDCQRNSSPTHAHAMQLLTYYLFIRFEFENLRNEQMSYQDEDNWHQRDANVPNFASLFQPKV